MEKNLIFIPAYNGFDKELKHCVETWKWYAKKYNIPIIVANESIDFEFETWGNGIWQRWKDERLLNGDWDKVLMIDSDTMIRWDAPNIFDVCKDKNFCVVRDASGSGLYHLRQWVKVNTNIKTPPQDYFNCGFLFMNKENYHKISENIQPYYEYWKSFHFMGLETNDEIRAAGKPDAVEQTPVNILSWELFPQEINYLPDIWNNMVMIKYDEASFINDSYIWHYTGPRMGGWGKKTELIEVIYNHIKYMYTTELCELFFKYKADKCPQLSHTYSKEYYDVLKDFKFTFNNVLEIGIGNNELMKPLVGEDYVPGASLKAWRDFFVNANIFGLDIEKDVLFSEDRINCFYTDQSNSDELENSINEIKKYTNDDNLMFDMILDDGSHNLDHMILSFNTIGKYVKSGGFYIIEDIRKYDLQTFSNLKHPMFEIYKVYPGKWDGDAFVVYKKI